MFQIELSLADLLVGKCGLNLSFSLRISRHKISIAHTLTCWGGREGGREEGEDRRENEKKWEKRDGSAELSITTNVEHTLNFQHLWCTVHMYTPYATVWG